MISVGIHTFGHQPIFKGYAAAPLKNLQIQPYSRRDLEIAGQLQAIGKREGFEVLIQTRDALYRSLAKVPRKGPFADSCWSQDHKFFQKTAAGEVVRVLKTVYPDQAANVRKLARLMHLPSKSMVAALEGGNFFLGKREDGSPYAIIGRETLNKTARILCYRDHGVPVSSEQSEETAQEKALRKDVDAWFKENKAPYKDRAVRQIARELGLKPEQITYINQPDFHIDLWVRPLHGNIVLLNDPALSFQALSEATRRSDNREEKAQLQFLRKSLKQYLSRMEKHGYSGMETIAAQLEEAGFQVIRVPGIFRMRDAFRKLTERDTGRCVVYTNAVVHQRDNGDLVYITNKGYLPSLNQVFEETLRKQAPWIKQVDWISGTSTAFRQTNLLTNRIATHLDLGGGIHCLVNERPDFERWA